MKPLTGERAALLLAASRIAAGTGAWAAPGLAARLFGADPKTNPAALFIVRTFGARDIAMGVGVAGSQGKERDRWLVLGVLVDALDAAAALLAVRSRRVPVALGLAATGTATASIAAGLRARRP